MKIYMSSSWNTQGRSRLVAHQLKRDGHEITFDWTKCAPPRKDPLAYAAAAKTVFGAIDESEAVVAVIFDSKVQCRGIMSEVSYALGKGIPVYLVVMNKTDIIRNLVSDYIDTCIYYHHPAIVRVSSINELLAKLSA